MNKLYYSLIISYTYHWKKETIMMESRPTISTSFHTSKHQLMHYLRLCIDQKLQAADGMLNSLVYFESNTVSNVCYGSFNFEQYTLKSLYVNSKVSSDMIKTSHEQHYSIATTSIIAGENYKSCRFYGTHGWLFVL